MIGRGRQKNGLDRPTIDIVAFIEPVNEQIGRLVGGPSLNRTVQELEGLAIGNQNPQCAPRHDFVEIPELLNAQRGYDR